MSAAHLPRIIVCEPSPRWAVLTRRFAPDLQISEARSLALADDMLRDGPAGVIAVVATEGSAADVLLRLAQWQREYPECALAAVLEFPAEDLGLALREAGAQLVIQSLFELPLLARMARRHQVLKARLDARHQVAADSADDAAHFQDADNR